MSEVSLVNGHIENVEHLYVAVRLSLRVDSFVGSVGKSPRTTNQRSRRTMTA